MKGETKQRFEDYGATFQERVVRTMFCDTAWCDQFVVPHLDSSMFSNNVHRWFASSIITYRKRFATACTRHALASEARYAFRAGKLDRKRDLAPVKALLAKVHKPPPDVSYIKRELHRFIKTQTMKDVIQNDIFKLMKEGKVDLFDQALQKVIDVQAPTDGDLGHDMGADRNLRYKRRKNWKPEGIPTGFKVDEYMKNGGPKKKQLAAIVGAPNSGKTMLLCHIAKQAVMLGQQRVLVISLEEDDLTIQDRLDSAFTGININNIEEGVNPKKIRRYWRRFHKEHKSQLYVKEMPMGVTTVAHIERYIKSLERKSFYPDVVVIDYAGLLKPEGVDDSRYEEIGSVYVELRSMAQRLNCLVWTAHQGNRGSLGKKIITMKDLAESFKPAMHADLLLANCQTEGEKERKRARLFSMKVRGGQAAMEFPVRLDYEHVRAVNLG